MATAASLKEEGGGGGGPRRNFLGAEMSAPSNNNPGNGGNQPGFPMLYSKPLLFDGKRMRKPVTRRTIDYYSTVVQTLETRLWRRPTKRDRPNINPDPSFMIDMLLPSDMLDCPVNAVTTKFVHTSTNKVRCPVNVIRWTPEGRRLITGSTSGEFTLWNGLTFNFETILQAHDTAVRAMEWTHNDQWMVTADHSGIVKYWQANMNNLKIIQAHKEPVRGISFSPTDVKFATASDDGTIRIWNFNEGTEEKVLTGHGWDVRCLDWHPYKCLLASGGKDNLVKLWDPKAGKALTTLHGHKNTVLDIKWNRNGNWLCTVGRDQTTRIYDIRTMNELFALRGHPKEVCSLSWHPVHERLLVTGGSEGSVFFWTIGDKTPVATLDTAHESNVWSMAWHPLGHVLATGSNDHATRFWTRCRPGDDMNDRRQQEAMAASAESGMSIQMTATTAGYAMSNGADESLPGLFSVYGGGNKSSNVAMEGLSNGATSTVINSFSTPISDTGLLPGLGNAPTGKQASYMAQSTNQGSFNTTSSTTQGFNYQGSQTNIQNRYEDSGHMRPDMPRQHPAPYNHYQQQQQQQQQQYSQQPYLQQQYPQQHQSHQSQHYSNQPYNEQFHRYQERYQGGRGGGQSNWNHNTGRGRGRGRGMGRGGGGGDHTDMLGHHGQRYPMSQQHQHQQQQPSLPPQMSTGWQTSGPPGRGGYNNMNRGRGGGGRGYHGHGQHNNMYEQQQQRQPPNNGSNYNY